VQDALDELDETIIVDISSVTNGNESGAQQVTAVITDDDLRQRSPSMRPAPAAPNQPRLDRWRFPFNRLGSDRDGRLFRRGRHGYRRGVDYTLAAGPHLCPGVTTRTSRSVL